MTDEFEFKSIAFSSDDVNSLIAEMIDGIDTIRSRYCDLIIVCLTQELTEGAEKIVSKIQEMLNPKVLIGCTASSIISNAANIEGQSGACLLLAQLPGVDLAPFHLDPPTWHDLLNSQRKFKDAVGIPKEAKIGLLFGDSLTTPLDQLLDAFNTWFPGLRLIGGIASGVAQSGNARLILNDEVFNSGTIGLMISGAIQTDMVLTHGCRPIGLPMTVTLSNDNLILSLDGSRPQDIIEQLISEMEMDDQEALRNGLFIGRPIDRQDQKFTRGDILISGVYGYDQSSGAIVVGDQFENGEIIHFHLCDPSTSLQDLEMSLVPQVLRSPPSAVLKFTCNGRGIQFFGHENAELDIITENLNHPPVIGIYCSSEIGSMHGRNYLLSNTTCLLLLRPDSDNKDDIGEN